MTRTTSLSSVPTRAMRGLVAIVCAALLAPGEAVFLAQATPPAATQTAAAETKLPPDQLDALVAPIALYPDPLLSQVLVASTYPLEIVQLQQWLAKNKTLKDKPLADAVAKQPWDPSIQAMAALPEVVKRLADDVQWTAELGNAFLDQQGDVMDAVQRMRKKAEGTGALKSNEQQKVETKVVEQKTVIVVEPASTEIVYVPSYNPVVVYGPPVYAYPPIYYPPSTGAIVAAGMISFGVGIAIGAAWGHGGWGWGCGWGGNNINVNVNNNFNRNTNVNRGGNSNWSHNPEHRGGAPYANQSTANKYGGTARGTSSGTSRQAGSGQQAGGAGAGGNRSGASGDRAGAGGDRAGAGGDRAGAGGDRAGAGGDRAGAGGDRAGAGGDRAGAGGDRAGAGDRAGTRDVGAGGGSDRVGTRDVGSGRSSSGSGAFGSSSGYSGSSAKASSARGSSSAGSRSSGGRSGGGGGGGRRR